MDRTLVICKPDAVERGLVGEIVGRFERRGMSIAAMDLRVVDGDTAAKHYEEHDGKPFYPDLISFITRGPVVALVVEGPEDTWQIVRTMMGVDQLGRGGAGHHPGRPQRLVHREPHPRLRLGGVGRARDRALVPGPGVPGYGLTSPILQFRYETIRLCDPSGCKEPLHELGIVA